MAQEQTATLIAEYNATYCGGMGGASEAFLRRYLEWQATRATPQTDTQRREIDLDFFLTGTPPTVPEWKWSFGLTPDLVQMLRWHSRHAGNDEAAYWMNAAAEALSLPARSGERAALIADEEAKKWATMDTHGCPEAAAQYRAQANTARTIAENIRAAFGGAHD